MSVSTINSVDVTETSYNEYEVEIHQTYTDSVTGDDITSALENEDIDFDPNEDVDFNVTVITSTGASDSVETFTLTFCSGYPADENRPDLRTAYYTVTNAEGEDGDTQEVEYRADITAAEEVAGYAIAEESAA